MNPCMTDWPRSSLARPLRSPSRLGSCGDNQTPLDADPRRLPGRRARRRSPCLPNLDGQHRRERAPAGHRHAHLATSSRPPASSARSTWPARTDGERRARAGIVGRLRRRPGRARSRPRAITGKWYAGSFPRGRVRDAVRRRRHGRRRSTGRTPRRCGCSAWPRTEADPPEGKTLLVYDAPVAMLRFPLAPGATLRLRGHDARTATVRGLPYAGTDIYEVTVDARGRVRLAAAHVHPGAPRAHARDGGAGGRREHLAPAGLVLVRVLRRGRARDEPARTRPNRDFTTAPSCAAWILCTVSRIAE